VTAPVTLYFIRHGETDWNREGRLQGQRDIPLNALGRAQAEECGRRLLALAPMADLDWLVSPLGRTRETAEIARREAGLDPMDYWTDDRLKEITFGRWEGLTWREVRAADPAGAHRREADKWGFAPPGGESYAMLVERMRGWLADLPTASRPLVTVAHGGVARALLHIIARVAPHEATVLDIWQGRVLMIRDGGYDWV
jgi:broad specificity phosphatase PhoE